MSINFDTNNIIIVAYPPNSGGKFLINCLGLSDGAVFQDRAMASRQLQGKCSSTDKMKWIREKLISVRQQGVWDDLQLGCGQLFGYNVNAGGYEQGLLMIYHHVINELSNSDKLFFLVAHGQPQLTACLSVWKNAKVVLFKNNNIFANYRHPYSFSIKMSENSKIDEELLKMEVFYWDADSYLSEEVTLQQIELLYKKLGLLDFNKEMVTDYYRLWIDALTVMKQFQKIKPEQIRALNEIRLKEQNTP